MLSEDLHEDVCYFHCIRAFGFSEPKIVEVVLDSGADGSILPLEYANVGWPDKSFDGSSYIDAQGKPISVNGARIAEVRFGPVVFRERFIIAAVTSPLISMARLLKDGWHLQNEGDGTMNLVRKHRHIPVHFKRNSLCATGVIRILTENTDVSSSTSPPSGQVHSAGHVRALTLGRAWTGMGQGWIQLSGNVFGLRSISPNHVDTTCCPSSVQLWSRAMVVNGNWRNLDRALQNYPPWLDRSTLRSAWWNQSLLLIPPWFLLNILVFQCLMTSLLHDLESLSGHFNQLKQLNLQSNLT